MCKSMKLFTVLLGFCLMLAGPVLGQQWTFSQDFSLVNNPSGTWTWGFISAAGQFTPYNSTFSPGDGIAGWALASTQSGGSSLRSKRAPAADPDAAGDIVRNDAQSANDSYGADLKPGQICIHMTPNGGKSAVRWLSPVTGVIRVSAGFTSQSFATLANLSVVKNGGQPLATARLDGFAGTGQLPDRRTGSSPEQAYSGSILVSEGDTIDFDVSCLDVEDRPEGFEMVGGHIGFDARIQLLKVGSLPGGGSSSFAGERSAPLNTVTENLRKWTLPGSQQWPEWLDRCFTLASSNFDKVLAEGRG